jgi:hypothetical protein
MPFVLTPQIVDEPLIERLERLRGRFRWIIFARDGALWLLLTALAFALLGFLDWKLHLPGAVRAIALFGIVVGSVIFFVVKVLEPLRVARDPLTLSLHIQEYYPQLRDSLASAVQFLDFPEDDRRSSVAFRQETIKQALRAADRHDFSATLNSRGLKRSLLAFLIGVAFFVLLFLFAPSGASIAAQRIAMPFSSVSWPTRTQIEIVWPDPIPKRMARGENLELKAVLKGDFPERVVLGVLVEGGTSFEQVYLLPRPETKNQIPEVSIRLEAARIPKNFRFRLRANDAETKWHTVVVLPPPILVPLDGRPSPQIELEFPKYTQLPPTELPDGSGIVEAVTGTKVTLRGATDRPIARAWIGYRAEVPRTAISGMLTTLSSSRAVDLPLTLLMSQEAWTPTPITIEPGGTRFEVTFTPHIAGSYLLRFEDDTGIGNGKLFDFRILPDPAPSVILERPSATKDSLALLPEAGFLLKAQASDRLFAVRQGFIEYRTDRKETPRKLLLTDLPTMSKLLPGLTRLMPGLGSELLPEIDLRPGLLNFEGRFSLKQFTRADGSPLQEGDSLILQVAAEDHDDVTVFKQPGRSHEIEILVVSGSHLDMLLQQAQQQLRNEFLQLKEQQREARSRVQEAIRQTREGALRPEDLEKLQQAEQFQSQVRGRINSPDDGLRSELSRLRQLIRDNQLPRSASTERIEKIGNELDRLGNEELEPIEPLIAQSRKEPPKAKPSLEGALRHQKEVEETLQTMLEKLEPWSGASEIRSEARLLQRELQKNIQQNAPLEKLPLNARKENLKPEQQAELDRATDRLEQSNERGRQLIEKIQRLASEKEKTAQEKMDLANEKERQAQEKLDASGKEKPNSPEQRALQQEANRLRAEAEQLRDSARALQNESRALQNSIQPQDSALGLQLLAGGPGFILAPEDRGGNGEDLKQQLSESTSQLRRGELNRSQQTQQQAIQNLQRIVDSLEEKGTQQPDQDLLQKKRDQGNRDLDQLIEKQELLQKKVKEANQIPDPKEREEALQRLAPEQEKLEQEARELAQRLNRAEAEDAAQELRRSIRQMEQAREELEQGRAADATQEDALERLDDAQRELDQVREEKEEQLLREKLAEVSDQIKALRDRQQRLLDESQRLQTAILKEKKWTRPLASSLNDLRDQQTTLAEEVRALEAKKFEGMRVFSRILQQSAEAMDATVERLKSRREEVLDQLDGITDFTMDLEEKAQAGIVRKQKLALKRLDQLLESLAPDKEMMNRPAPKQAGPMGEPNMGGGGQGSSIPPLAQLKALRSLQADLLERTAQFDREHPDRTKLNEEELKELDELQKAQLEVGELLDALTPKNGDEP